MKRIIIFLFSLILLISSTSGFVNVTDITTFSPFIYKFNYTVTTNFTADNGSLDNYCLNFSNTSYSSQDESYCYNLNEFYIEDKALLPGSEISCYMNLSHDSTPYTVTYTWYNATGDNIKSGTTNCEHEQLCTIDTLEGSYVTQGDVIHCQAQIIEDFFTYSILSNNKTVGNIGACTGANIYPILNITYYDEITDININVSNSMDVLFYDGTANIPLEINFTDSYYNTICTDVNPATTVLNLTMYQDITIRKEEYVTRVNKYPLVEGITVSNDPVTQLSLYLIPLDNSTTITYTWQSTKFEFIDGTMLIYKCNLDNTKDLVDATIISSGIATSNLQLYTQPYSYEIVVDGTTYTDSTFTDCHVESVESRTFYVNLEEIDLQPVVGLYLVECGLTKTGTNIVSMQWEANPEDPSDITGCIVGKQQTPVGLVEIYRNCTTGSTGSFTRSIPSNDYAYSIYGEITQNDLTSFCQDVVEFNVTNNASTFGATGVLGIFFLLIGIGLAFDKRNDLRLLAGGISIALAFTMQFINIGYGVVISIIFLIVLIIFIGRYSYKRQVE